MIGRPWLIFGIERKSGMPHGYFLSWEPPNYRSVMECLLLISTCCRVRCACRGSRTASRECAGAEPKRQSFVVRHDAYAPPQCGPMRTHAPRNGGAREGQQVSRGGRLPVWAVGNGRVAQKTARRTRSMAEESIVPHRGGAANMRRGYRRMHLS